MYSLNDETIEQLELILEKLELILEKFDELYILFYNYVDFVKFCFPLLIGVIIGLIALKTFWDGASRW